MHILRIALIALFVGMVPLMFAVVSGMRALMDLEVGMPILKWLTFDEILKLGHKPFSTRIALNVLRERDQLEIRIRNDIDQHLGLDSLEAKIKTEMGGRLMNLDEITHQSSEYFEYRLTGRPRRRKKLDVVRGLGKMVLQPVIQR